MPRNKDALLKPGANEEWETPAGVVAWLERTFGHIDLDPAATTDNTLSHRHFNREVDGLSKAWRGRHVFVNPPYGPKLGDWVSKAKHETILCNAQIVTMLLPARTDTSWFCWEVARAARVIYWIKGRLCFVGAKSSAPFPSLIVVFTASSWWAPNASRDFSRVLMLTPEERGFKCKTTRKQ